MQSPHNNPGDATAEWVSLAELGRCQGLPATHVARRLAEAGLRQASGEPTATALAAGLARHRHPVQPSRPLWHRRGCAAHLEQQQQEPRLRQQLVALWADLLTALQQASGSVTDSAVEEMAAEIPSELVKPVNRELRQRGSALQVRARLRKAAAPRLLCAPSRA
jgi:hypothetical protein